MNPIAIKLCAKNDPSGNPQRGWLVYEVTRYGDVTVEYNLVEFFDEGYRGIEALKKKFLGIQVISEIEVMRSYYHKMRREYPEK